MHLDKFYEKNLFVKYIRSKYIGMDRFLQQFPVEAAYEANHLSTCCQKCVIWSQSSKASRRIVNKHVFAPSEEENVLNDEAQKMRLSEGL